MVAPMRALNLPTVATVALVALLAAAAPPAVAQDTDSRPHSPVLFCRRPESAFPRPPTAMADDAEQAPEPEPEPAPAPKPHDAGCHCETHKNVMFSTPGSQTGGIREKFAKSPEDCCNLCRNDPSNGCTHYTWTPTGTRTADEWAAALASGKAPNNCMLIPHGGGMPLIKRNTPHQNRTSGFLKQFSPSGPSPSPDPDGPPAPTTPPGNLNPVQIVKNDLKEPWVPYGGLSFIVMSMLVCVAAYGKRQGLVLVGALSQFRGNATAPKRGEYARIGEASAAPDAGVTIDIDVDIDSVTSVTSSRAVSSVSSLPDMEGPCFYDEQNFDDFVEDFGAAVAKLVRDRKWLLYTYKQCFVGSEALEWIKHWCRTAGEGDSDERAVALAQKLLDMALITHVTAVGPGKFKATEFYRVCDTDQFEDDDDDASIVSSEFTGPGSEASHTSTMMDFDLRSSDEMHHYEQAVHVLSASLNIGVRPPHACLERLALTIPPLLAASVRLRALATSSSTPNLAALLDQSAEVEVKARKPDADIAEHARALQEALQQHDDLTTHTLYTKADRLRMTVLALKHEAADATRRYNMRNCPLLAVLSVDGVRTTVMRHLRLKDLCRMRCVSLDGREFADEILRETEMPTMFGGQKDGMAIPLVEQLSTVGMRWRQLPPMVEARYDPGTCRISAGRVIIAGGRDATNVLSSAEEFDPVERRWSALPPMQTARLGCRASMLPDGRVVVMGGFDGRSAVASVEAYTPATRSWTRLPDMLSARTGFAAGVLSDGTIVVAGGFGPGGALSAVEQYTPATDEWRTLPSMITERSGCDGCVAPSGELWVAGGTSKGERLNACEVFTLDPETREGSWSTAPPLLNARHKLGLCTIAGQIVAMGGEGTPVSPRAGQAAQKDGQGPPCRWDTHHVKSVEVFDASSQQWKRLVDLPDGWSTNRGCTSV